MLKLNIFRVIAIFLSQLTLILFLGGKYDLIFGFNRMESGFTVLLFLFVFVPFLNLSWIIIEIISSIRLLRHRRKAVWLLMPFMAVFFFMESIAIDLYLLSHARM